METSKGAVDGGINNIEFEEKTKDSLSILEKIQAKFGHEVMKAFEKEDIIDEASIEHLSQREADAPIFSKLLLTYGKAVAFKKEFGRKSRPCSPVAVKPTMADIATFSPEHRRLYLSKRKKIGTMATERWGPKFPKFNSPQMKLELSEFSAQLEPVCGMPEVGFNAEGIAKHVQDFCNEQRRYLKLKTSNSKDPDKKSTSEEKSKVIKRGKKGKKLQGYNDLSESDESDVDEANCENRSPSSSVKSGEQDGLNSGHDTEIVNDSSATSDESPSYSEALKTSANKKKLDSRPLKTNQLIVKAVFSKILSRDETVSVLKKKFSVQPKNLTTLSPIQLLGVLAKKLVNNGYCTISKMENINSLKMSDISVSKEIET